MKCGNFWSSCTRNSRGRCQTWRFYASGQFLFKGHLWDAVDESFQATLHKEADISIKPFSGNRWNEVRGFTSFVALIYSCTEALLLAARLAQAVPYHEETVHMEISLRNILHYALASAEPGVSLHGLYMSEVERVRYADDVEMQRLVSNPAAAARTTVRTLFEAFNWNDVREEMMEQWQRSIDAM